MQQTRYGNLKLGFVGLGKYGYSVMKAILKSGHHNLDNIYFEKINNNVLRNLSEEKRNEVVRNYKDLETFLKKSKGDEKGDIFFKEHGLPVKDLTEKIAENRDGKGALIVSCNIEAGEKIFKEITSVDKNIWKNVWILSSVSRLEIARIKKIVNKDVGVIRYIQNLATKVGSGIVSAYIEGDKEGGKVVLERVFQGLGKVVLLNNQESIDSARIITGSTIGLSAYFAKILSDAISELGIECLGKSQRDATEIVYHSFAGMLALCKQNEIGSWDDLLKNIQVTPGKAGEPGTVKFIIDDLDSRHIPQIVKDSIRRCHDEYLVTDRITSTIER